jgi:NAD-dependent SIR2 family protein deacetylase
MDAFDSLFDQAARSIASAEALLIGAGAGMGVDSGLPDFRGAHGFWRAYPAYQKLGLDFVSLANPAWFRRDPTLAWGFYGHRLQLYRRAAPHAGFAILRRWAERMRHGAFVYTSNVDGHFQRAGFDPERIEEVHGTIHQAQCSNECGIGIFAADAFEIDLDEETMRAREPLPACPRCGALARPNILMFGDGEWDYTHSHRQEMRMLAWLEQVANARLVIIECGAGLAIPTVRYFCERVAGSHAATLIRINVREATVPAGQIGLATGALAALRAIDERWGM